MDDAMVIADATMGQNFFISNSGDIAGGPGFAAHLRYNNSPAE